jgi:hypothetical protein
MRNTLRFCLEQCRPFMNLAGIEPEILEAKITDGTITPRLCYQAARDLLFDGRPVPIGRRHYGLA